MSRSRGDDPEVLLRELQARQPAQNEQDVQESLNLIERIVGAITPVDDAVRDALGSQDGQPGQGGINEAVRLLQQQVAGREDTRQLPVGRVGTAVEDIPNSQSGTALFESWSGEVAAEIKANEDISKRDTIAITGGGNLAEVTTSVGDVRDVGGTDEVLRIEPDQLALVQNQSYVQSGEELNPSVSAVSFDGDLGPGDEEVVVSVESRNPNWVVDVSEIGVTSHKGDVDNDSTTADQSVVTYHYEYIDSLSGSWTELPGSPTVLPIGDLANPAALFEDSIIGPMFGFRIRFENRTDNTTNSFTVDEEDLGGLIRARVV